MTIRGFANSSSVPPLPSFSERDRSDSPRPFSRMSRRKSLGICGMPTGRDCQRQKRRNPLRCQRIKVSGWTFQERKVKPRRAHDSTRLIMVILGRMFSWRDALVNTLPDVTSLQTGANGVFAHNGGNLAADLKLDDAPKLQASAAALLKDRMESSGKDFPPARCLPPGVLSYRRFPLHSRSSRFREWS
jgi:hypothetical protein